jgi:tRNA(Met) C34 N-acetyltransferase TmcA
MRSERWVWFLGARVKNFQGKEVGVFWQENCFLAVRCRRPTGGLTGCWPACCLKFCSKQRSKVLSSLDSQKRSEVSKGNKPIALELGKYAIPLTLTRMNWMPGRNVDCSESQGQAHYCRAFSKPTAYCGSELWEGPSVACQCLSS